MRFAQGFVAMLPLWTGAIPVGVAYGVAARDAGLTLVDTQLMSLTVFSAAAQMSAIALIGAGTPAVIVIGSALALNMQLLLIGLSVGKQTRPRLLGRLIAAYFLTDGAYGVALAGANLTLARLLGAGVSMFTAWNLGTILGAAAMRILPMPDLLAGDFVAPLAFLAVLVPLIRTWALALTALIAGAAAVGLTLLMTNGMAVLAASLVGSIVGAWWARRASGCADAMSKSTEKAP